MGELIESRALRALMGSAAAVACVAFAAPAMAQTRSFDVSAQSASKGIHAFARQAGIQLLAPAREVRGKRTNAVKGSYTIEQALRMLLQGTGLEASRDPGTGITTIRAAGQAQTASSRERAQTTRTVSSSGEEGDTTEAGSEIIVTAQKREERLQEVPVPVTALQSADLARANLSRIEDYYARIPGLNLNPFVGGVPSLSIRGVTTGGFTNPTVGITINDVPFGGSTALGGGFTPPELDPSELQRVEVLRGPQGTLYGASSIGGLLKFVTVDPDLDEVSGRIGAGLNAVSYSRDVGYNLNGAINMPISETVAVRVSGYYRLDPGYIDDPIRNVRDLNERESRGGRASLLWEPSPDFKIKIGALVQDFDQRGPADSQIGPFGELESGTIPGIGGFARRTRLYDATIDAKIGNATITSISAYGTNRLSNSQDLRSLAFLSEDIFGVSGTPFTSRDRLKKFTQELRISVPLTDNIDWLVGGFYSDERVNHLEDIVSADSATGDLAGILISSENRVTYKELAAFTNVTFRLSDRFDIQFGARQSHIKQSLSISEDGALSAGMPGFTTVDRTKSDAFTYLITPRFKISPTVMVYARLASGYRPGGPNFRVVGDNSQFAPDKTYNYELGIKGSVLDRAVDFDLSLYKVDWKDIQLRASNGIFNYVINGGEAKSNGAELTVNTHPADGVTLGGFVAYNDAELTADLPPSSTSRALAGDRLPGASRWSAAVYGDVDTPINENWTAFIGSNLSFVGSRIGVFTSGGPREYLPSYARLDAKLGARSDDWTFTLYINNVTDKRGVIARETDRASVTYIQPRTIGLSLEKTF